ncbi:MAG: PQQ-binding-like beta-propeller repeat protein [Burkholderiales bacterium]|nr:PQQ-binding-like beta-propeller repeat protein [Burkholderiales bacterium]
MGSRLIRCMLAILIVILLQACGGGGGGGTGETGTPTTPSVLVSGSVQAPGGQLASLEQSNWTTRLASMFISASYADVIGLANVPNGTVVELVRVDAFTGGATGAPLATTSVSAGRYSFDLTSLGLDYSTTLQARLASATGIQMRTFLNGAVANLDPNSEAAVQLILESIAAMPGSSLAVLTVKDLDDLVASMDMLTSAAGITADSSTASTVSAIKSTLKAKQELSALLSTKLTAGHAATGPGDLANYFPLSPGDTWTYSVSENGAAAASAEVAAVGTATQRNGATVTPVSFSSTSFPLPSSGGPAPTLENTEFYVKDSSGLISYGNSTDPAGLTTLAPTFKVLKLPAKAGDTLVAVDKTGSFNFGEDLDGDGIPETLTRLKIDNVVTGYQSISVAAGTFRCLVVEIHLLTSIQASSNNVTVTATGKTTWFLAPGVGIVRQVQVTNGTASNGAVLPQVTSQRDLVGATIAGVTIGNPPPAATPVPTSAPVPTFTPNPSPLPPLSQSVAYQIDYAHSGQAKLTGPIAFPSAPTWSVTLGGAVSYPLIADGKVFVLTAGLAGGYGTQLYALDKLSGSIVWGPVAIAGTYYWSGHAYDHGKIFVVNYDGLLKSIDANTGLAGWSTKLDQYSFSAPPTAVNGIVYVAGSGGGGTLYAVDESNGNVLWSKFVANGGNSSPTVSGDGVFVSYPCQVYKFDPLTGGSLWHYSGGCSGGGGKTAAYANGSLYVRDRSDSTARIYSAATGTQVSNFAYGTVPALTAQIGFFNNTSGFVGSAGTLQGVDLPSHNVLWSFAGDGQLVSAPIVINQYVVIGSSSGNVYALDSATGAQVWSGNASAPIVGAYEQSVTQPWPGLGAGEGFLVVPAGNVLTAWRVGP